MLAWNCSSNSKITSYFGCAGKAGRPQAPIPHNQWMGWLVSTTLASKYTTKFESDHRHWLEHPTGHQDGMVWSSPDWQLGASLVSGGNVRYWSSWLTALSSAWQAVSNATLQLISRGLHLKLDIYRPVYHSRIFKTTNDIAIVKKCSKSAGNCE